MVGEHKGSRRDARRKANHLWNAALEVSEPSRTLRKSKGIMEIMKYTPMSLVAVSMPAITAAQR